MERKQFSCLVLSVWKRRVRERRSFESAIEATIGLVCLVCLFGFLNSRSEETRTYVLYGLLFFYGELLGGAYIYIMYVKSEIVIVRCLLLFSSFKDMVFCA